MQNLSDSLDLGDNANLNDDAKKQLIRYKQVLKMMPASVILLDEKGYIVEANPESFRLLGEPLLKQKWLDVIARVFRPRVDDGHEVSLRDGRRVKLAISASDLGQLILITDLTQTRLLQSKISYLQRFYSLGKMIASLAHQIRTPLSAALLYASNLQSLHPSKKMHEKFQKKLVVSLNDIEKQVNDMLFFAKNGDNKVVGSFSITELLNELNAIIETLITQESVDFTIEGKDKCLQLHGNIHALANALANLIINAIQACDKNCKVILSIKTEKNNLLLCVKDNGLGMNTELQSKILEPFFTTKEKGSGLGLTVVQMICHAHQGSLSLKSEKNQGSAFTLILPIVKNAAWQTQREK